MGIEIRKHSGEAALVVATLALVVASGAPSWAAEKISGASLKNNSVTSAKIQDGTLVSADVKDGGIKGADIQDGSVGNPDLAEGAVAGSNILDGAVNANKIVDGSVGQSEIASGGVSTLEVANGSLDLVDSAKYTGSFGYDAPAIAAGDCFYSTVGVTEGGSIDLVVVTPSSAFSPEDAGTNLVFYGQNSTSDTLIRIVACNISNAATADLPVIQVRWATFDR